MSATCEGYACPPEHSVPASEVIVHRPPELPPTGATIDPVTIILASTCITVGAILVALRRRTR